MLGVEGTEGGSIRWAVREPTMCSTTTLRLKEIEICDIRELGHRFLACLGRC